MLQETPAGIVIASVVILSVFSQQFRALVAFCMCYLEQQQLPCECAKKIKQYLQKFVSPTRQLIIENSKAAPSKKNPGRKRYIPKYFFPGQASRKLRRFLL